MSSVEQFPSRIQITFGGPEEEAALGENRYPSTRSPGLPGRRMTKLVDGSGAEANTSDVLRAGVQVSEEVDEPGGEVLVEQQPH